MFFVCFCSRGSDIILGETVDLLEFFFVDDCESIKLEFLFRKVKVNSSLFLVFNSFFNN